MKKKYKCVIPNLQMWVSYHDDSLINKYHLKETRVYKLFATHKIPDLNYNINYFHRICNEAATIYYVWRNQIYSEFVGFEHYRRRFNLNNIYKLDQDLCYCMFIRETFDYRDDFNMVYLRIPKYEKFYDIILDILDRQFGKNNIYSYILTHDNMPFISNECFIMSWDKFNKLCKFAFWLMFTYDKRIGGNMKEENYMRIYNNNSYFARWHIFERIIGCWIAANFKRNHIIVFKQR